MCMLGNGEVCTCVCEACMTGDVRTVQQLLSRGVGVNVEYGEVCTCVC